MRRNKLMRIVALVSAMIMAMSVVGCSKGGSEKVDNSVEDKKNLKVALLAKGYGTDWLYAMAEAFEKEHEGVNVDITLMTSNEVVVSELKNSDTCDTDLYFDILNGQSASIIEKMKNVHNGEQALRDLTYLYNTQIPGEEVTLGDKMNASLKKGVQFEGRDTEDTSDDVFYTIPYVSGTIGMYYNETVIDNALGKGNWSTPRTTDEFKALCDRLKAKNCHMLISGGLDAWANGMFLTWWAQYEGIENYYKFFEGVGFDTTKNREAKNSSNIFKQPGRLESLKVSYDIAAYDNGFILPNSAEVGTNNLNEYQTRFTLAKNNYAFYPCGEWLMQELKNNSTVKADSVIKLMKSPVISSIINSTDSYSNSGEKRLPNITSDAMLAEVVSYVDGVGELPAGVTQEEVEVVRQARNTIATNGTEHVVYAPVFSNAKSLADEFLLFMASDKGIQVLKDNCIGGFAPYEYEYSNLDVTEQSVGEIVSNAVYVDCFAWDRLFYVAGVNAVKTGAPETIDALLCVPGGLTAEEMNERFLKQYSGDKWQNYLEY